MFRRNKLSRVYSFVAILVILSMLISLMPASLFAAPPTEPGDVTDPVSIPRTIPELGFSADYEVKLLPGKTASLHALKGLLKLDFPADSSKDGVFVSVHPGSRLADRPLPGGLDTYLAFTLEGSIIGEGGIPVGTLDKPFKLSHTLDKLGKRDLKIFRWNSEIARWEELSSGTIGESILLTDYAIGGPPQTGSHTLSTPDPIMSATAPGAPLEESSTDSATRSLLTLPGGQADYLGGYLDLPGSGYNGFVAVGTEDGHWQPGNVGKLNSQPRQLLQGSDGTFYSLGEDGYLRRSEDGYTWKELRKNKSGTLENYRIVQIQTVGTTLLAAMTTDSNNTDKSGYYKSTDRGDTWTHVWTPPIPSGQTQHMKGVSVSLSPADNNLMYFVAVQDWITPAVYKVFKSTDGGTTWGASIYTISTTTIQKIVPDPSSAQKAFMVRGDGIYKTGDQGTTWNLKRAVTQNDPSMGNFLISGDGAKIWYAPGNDGIEKSTDNGASWTHVQILPTGSAGKISCLDKAGSGTYIYAGVDTTTTMPASNLYMSSDSGANWTDITGDMGTSNYALHDSYGPMRIRAIVAQVTAPDPASKYGVQLDNLIYSDGTAMQAGDYFSALEGTTNPDPTNDYSAKDKTSGPFAGNSKTEGGLPNGVNTVTGNYFYHRTDLSLTGKGPAVQLARFYNSQNTEASIFGSGWSFSYGVRQSEDPVTQRVTIADGTSRHVFFMKQDDGTYKASPGAAMTYNPNHGNPIVTLKNNDTYNFDGNGRLTSVKDHDQNAVDLYYNASGKLTSLEDQAGRKLIFNYTNGLVTSVDLKNGADPVDRTMYFSYTTYGSKSYLTSFTDMNGKVTQYGYESHNSGRDYYLSSITDANGHVQVTNTYDDYGRVLSQEDADSNETTFTWNQAGSIEQLGYVTITNPRNASRVYQSDPTAATLEVTNTDGLHDTYSWNGNCGVRLHVDSNLNKTRMSWDGMNNLTGVYDAIGNSHNWTYVANKPTNERWTLLDTDPMNLVSNGNFEEDSNGDGIPNGWSAQGAGVSFGINTANQRYGTNSLSLYAGTGSTGFFQSSLIAVSGATAYNLSYDVKTETLTLSRPDLPAGIVVVTELDGSQNFVRDQILFNTLTGTLDWNRKSASFTTNGATRYVLLRPALAYAQSGNATGTVLFDGILLETGTTQSSYYTKADNGFGPTGNITSRTDQNGKTTNFDYNGNGSLTKVTAPTGDAVDIEYDPDGNPKKITDGDGKITYKLYDNFSRVISETNPLGETKLYAYDNEDRQTRVTDAKSNVTYTEYDNVGNSTVITDTNGKVTYYAYDNKNQLHTVTDALSNVTTYNYDEVGNKTSVTDGRGKTTTYQYDLRDRLTQVSTPLGKTTHYEYDNVGNTTLVTDANGLATNMEYNGVNLITLKTYPDSTPTYTHTVKYTYNKQELLASMKYTKGSSVSTYSYGYDDKGQMTSKTVIGTGTFNYLYDDAGRLVQITYPDGKIVQYEYNKRNLMKKVTDWSTPAKVTNYTYDDAGRLATASYPNSTSMSYQYDLLGKTKNVKYKDGGGNTVHEIAYQRDNVGNTTAITDTVGTTTTVKNFTYDDNYQLTNAAYDADNSEAFQYDEVGNRTVLTATVSGIPTVTSYTYDDDNRMTAAGGTTYGWDDNGNMTSKTVGGVTTNYSYDYENRLTQITDGANTHSYAYDGDGLRISATRNGVTTNYIWDTHGDLAQIISDGTNTYLYGVDRIAKYAGGAANYYYADALGSVREMRDGSGTLNHTYDYKAFGDILTSTGSTGPYFQYSGQQLDDESGLIYLRARYYDPLTGRFLTKDPMSGSMEDPSTQNPYVYAANSPLSLGDPTGLLVWGVGIQVSYGAVGAKSYATYLVSDDKGNNAIITTEFTGYVVDASMGVSALTMVSDADTIEEFLASQANSIDVSAAGGGWGPRAAGAYNLGITPSGKRVHTYYGGVSFSAGLMPGSLSAGTSSAHLVCWIRQPMSKYDARPW